MKEFIGLPRHVTWVTAVHGTIQIKDMESSHLRNAIRMLEGQIAEDNWIRGPAPSGHDPKVWFRVKIALLRKKLYLRIMKAELEYRKQHDL